MTTSLEKSDEWRLEAARTIGGVGAGFVTGTHRFGSRAGYAAQILAAVKDSIPPPPLPLTDDLRRGMVFERIAIEQTADKLGVPIKRHDQNEFVYHSDFPWAHVLPDGYVELPDGRRGLVEVKVPRPATVARLRMKGLFPAWQVQAQHYMAVTGYMACVFGILEPVSAQTEVVLVNRDDTFIAELMRQEQAFYQSVLDGVLPADEPAPVEEPEPGLAVFTGTEVVEAAQNYRRLYQLQDELEAVAQEAKIRLAELVGCKAIPKGDGVQFVGGPEAFEIPGIIRVRHRPTKARTSFDRVGALEDLRDFCERLGETFRPSDYEKLSAVPRPWVPYLFNKGE